MRSWRRAPLSAAGSADSVVGDLRGAADYLHEVITLDLRCVVKVTKSAVAASDPKVARRVRNAMAERRGADSRVIEVLGCDYTAGARRGDVSRLEKQAKRVARAAARCRRAAP